MKKEDAEKIKKSAKENYGDDLDLAIAAHVYTPGVVAKCGNVIPPFADKKLLSFAKANYTRLLNPEKKPEVPAEVKAKKPKAKKPKAKK
jgi:hypothetical protein